jgi:hypothetical protein
MASMTLDLLPSASLSQFADLTIKYGTQTYSVNRSLASLSSGLISRLGRVSTIDLPDLASINAAPNIAADVIDFMFGRKISVSPVPLFILGFVLEIPALIDLKAVCQPMSPETASLVAAACHRVGRDPSFLWLICKSISIVDPLDMLQYLWHPKLLEQVVPLKNEPPEKIDMLLSRLIDALPTNPHVLPVIAASLNRLPSRCAWVRRIFETPGVDLRLFQEIFWPALGAIMFFEDKDGETDIWGASHRLHVTVDFDPPQCEILTSGWVEDAFTCTGDPPTFTVTFRDAFLRITTYTIRANDEARPTSWRIDGSVDGKRWHVVDDRQNAALGSFQLKRRSPLIKKIRFTQLTGTGGKVMKLQCFAPSGEFRKHDTFPFK